MSDKSNQSVRPLAELTIKVNGRRQADPEHAFIVPGGRVRWFNDSGETITVRFDADACPLRHEHGRAKCGFTILPKHHGGAFKAGEEFGAVQIENGQFEYVILITEDDGTAGNPKIIIQDH